MTTDDEYESDTQSVASVDSLWGNDPEEIDVKDGWQDEVLETVDALGERKGSSTTGREELLKTFVRVASLKVITEDTLEGRGKDLVAILGRTIKGGRSNKEVTLSARAISLLAASTPEIQSLSTSILPLLQQIISHGETDLAPAALIHAMASISFFSPTLTSIDLYPVIDFYAEIVQSKGRSIGEDDDDEAIAASIEGLAILLSVLENPLEKIQAVLPILVKTLSSSSLTVRLAAGESIALAYELAAPPSSESDEDYDEEPTEEPIYDDIDHLTSLLASLSTASTKKMSKNSRREQHSLFRDILRTVSSHQPLPTQKLRFARKEELRLDSWGNLLRLKHLRRIFTHGLHVHLAGNVYVREVLDLPPPSDHGSVGSSDEDEGMSTAERRTLQKEVRRLRQGKVRRDRKRAGEGRMIDVFGVDDE
jgi:Interferon-related developmental regulator (IFRD)